MLLLAQGWKTCSPLQMMIDYKSLYPQPASSVVGDRNLYTNNTWRAKPSPSPIHPNSSLQDALGQGQHQISGGLWHGITNALTPLSMSLPVPLLTLELTHWRAPCVPHLPLCSSSSIATGPFPIFPPTARGTGSFSASS